MDIQLIDNLNKNNNNNEESIDLQNEIFVINIDVSDLEGVYHKDLKLYIDNEYVFVENANLLKEVLLGNVEET